MSSANISEAGNKVNALGLDTILANQGEYRANTRTLLRATPVRLQGPSLCKPLDMLSPTPNLEDSSGSSLRTCLQESFCICHCSAWDLVVIDFPDPSVRLRASEILLEKSKTFPASAVGSYFALNSKQKRKCRADERVNRASMASFTHASASGLPCCGNSA